MYYTDEILPAAEVLEVWEKAKQKEKTAKETRERDRQIAVEKEARGREMFAKFIPETARAVIVAEFEVDKCDCMTDYFATSVTKTVILGWSNHTRDLFTEMRKFADRIPETAHLERPPEVDSNQEPQTERNKTWWHPADEHREKYSQGHGYYLKAVGRYSTGWLIRKVGKYRDSWPEYLFRSLAERYVFDES